MGRQSIYINSLIIVYIILKTIYNYLYWMGNTCMSTMKILFLVLKWKKNPVLKAKIKSLIIYNQYIYSHKPWKPIMTSEMIYSQIFNNMVYDLFFLFPFFFLWILLKLIVLICMYHFFFSILTFVCKSCI